MLTRNEFEVLYYCLRKDGVASQRGIAEGCNVSVGTANNVLRKLESEGYINASYGITSGGLNALEPYKVENAVIMAAGFSSRFAPVSFERPKGVLKVRGEVLIERQIRQLQEAGIADITVVVGYKKEEFFYLEDLLGVKIVVNEEYANRNNNSTLFKVQNILGNTFVCSSDNYFVNNPFEQYVYRAYYACVFEEGDTEEYCLQTQGKDRLITGVTVGGYSALAMMGHTYWDKDFSKQFVSILNHVYNDPATAPKLWEDIYREHLGQLKMVAREYPIDDIWEFDSLEELKGFDPSFLRNVDSEIMDNICTVLKCQREDIADFVPIKQGLNLSVRFEVDGNRYVYRHPGTGTDEIINRESEAFSQGVAKKLGVDDTFIYEDPDEGWKLSYFVDNCIPFDYHNCKHVDRAMEIARTLHNSGEVSPWSFDVYMKGQEIVGMIDKPAFADFDELAERAARIYAWVQADGVEPVLCHNDFYDPNFLVYGENMALIDWEYSAMSDYASDLGTFICCSDYGIEEAEQVIDKYFEGKTTPEQMRHCMAYVSISAYYWFVWALYKDATGDPVGEWLYLWYRMTKLFGKYAEELYMASGA